MNPAYSSVSGQVKFAHAYTISIHQAAALVIARRFYSYSERLPKQLDKIPTAQGFHIALPGLVKSPAGNLWKSWAIIQRQLKMGHVAYFQKLTQLQAGRTRQASFPENDALPF